MEGKYRQSNIFIKFKKEQPPGKLSLEEADPGWIVEASVCPSL